jgi:hypothetical protein
LGEPSPLTLESPHTLFVQQTPVVTSGTVPRSAVDLPVLGLELTAFAAAPDTLTGLRLLNRSAGPSDAVADPNAEIASVVLWADRDDDGAVSAADTQLETLVPGPGDTLAFGATSPLQLVLNDVPQRLLVTLTPDSTTVRDAERLAVRLNVSKMSSLQAS